MLSEDGSRTSMRSYSAFRRVCSSCRVPSVLEACACTILHNWYELQKCMLHDAQARAPTGPLRLCLNISALRCKTLSKNKIPVKAWDLQ